METSVTSIMLLPPAVDGGRCESFHRAGFWAQRHHFSQYGGSYRFSLHCITRQYRRTHGPLSFAEHLCALKPMRLREGYLPSCHPPPCVLSRLFFDGALQLPAPGF